jgi:glycosyltransferase involved in cell wall biosynthesis
MEEPAPLVSVVIPTRYRPDLVVRAVHSALNQSLQAIEVIVVVDGPDDETLEVLKAIEDARLHIKPLPHNLGPAEARNAGVKAARSRWVAFLDHDDEWLPQKLSIQLHIAQQSSHPYPIIGCRLIVRHKMRDLVWPTRFPKPDEPISEYLFRRTQLFAGEAILQSSTIFTARALLLAVPFRKEAQRHDDLDWLLRTTTLKEVGVQFVPETAPLAIWHRDDTRPTLSSNTDWRFSLAWINQNRDLVTKRAYASFLMAWLSANAMQEGNRKESWLLFRQAYRYGTPSVLDVILFAGIWLFPPKMRAKMVLLFLGKRPVSPGLCPLKGRNPQHASF